MKNLFLSTLLFRNTQQEEQEFIYWFFIFAMLACMLYTAYCVFLMIRTERKNNVWRKELKPGDEAMLSMGGNEPNRECTIESVNEDESIVIKMKVRKGRLYMKKEDKK